MKYTAQELMEMMKKKDRPEEDEEILEDDDSFGLEEEVKVPTKDEVIAWFKENMYPDDDDVHEWAEENDFNPEKTEEVIYAALSDFLKEDEDEEGGELEEGSTSEVSGFNYD